MFSVGALFIPCIVGIFFFDEPMNVWQWAGLLLFIVAMYFMVSPAKEKEKTTTKISAKTVFMLVLMLLGGGGTMVAQKAFSKVVPNGSVATYSFLMFAFNSVILYACYMGSLFLDKKQIRINQMQEDTKDSKGLSKILLICGLILALAVFVINMLVTELGKYISSAILFSVSYAIGIVITILVGVIFYKEKITIKNIIGIILCVGALTLINFF